MLQQVSDFELELQEKEKSIQQKKSKSKLLKMKILQKEVQISKQKVIKHIKYLQIHLLIIKKRSKKMIKRTILKCQVSKITIKY